MTTNDNQPNWRHDITRDAFSDLGVPAAIAERLATRYPNCDGLAAATPAEITRSGGGRVRGGQCPAWAERLAAATTIGRMLATRPHRARCNSPAAAHEILTRYVAHERAECFAVVCLDARQGVIESAIVHRGDLASVSVHPREVYRPAVACGAHSILVAHNHPSGDAEPSAADIELTQRLVAAGNLVGIALVDHLVITPGAFSSLGQLGVGGL